MQLINFYQSMANECCDCHPELNPIELMWALVKNYVEWKKNCDHITKIEDDYLQREHIVDEVQELIIRVGDDTDPSTDFFSESEDEIVATQGEDDLGCQPLL
jgi:hypothetical protein